MVWSPEPGGGHISGLVGTSIRRIEDAVLVTGRGAYLDDQRAPGMLHAAFVRSPHAHAHIARIDTAASRQLAGVAGVWTAAALPQFPPLPATVPPGTRVPYRPLLARETVRHVGEPVALIVATDRALATDAVDCIDVEYELLEPVLDAEAALRPEAPLVHPELGSNEGQ